MTLDTDLAGRHDAMDPVELLLSALAACMLKGIERVTPMLKFKIEGAEVRLEAIRQDAPPKVMLIRYEIIVDSAETDHRLELLHRNILKYSTIQNRVLPPCAAAPRHIRAPCQVRSGPQTGGQRTEHPAPPS